MTILAALKSRTDIARTLQLHMPGRSAAPAGRWRMQLRPSTSPVDETIALEFDSAVGSIHAVAWDNAAKTLVLALLANAADVAALAGDYYADLELIEDGATSRWGEFVWTFGVALTRSQLPPRRSFADLSAWGPLIDIAGSDAATVLQVLERGPPGPPPATRWTNGGTVLEVQQPDGSWLTSADLTGPDGSLSPTAAAASTAAVNAAAAAIEAAAIATTKASVATADAIETAQDRVAVASDKNTVAALLATFRSIMLGAFASDAAAVAFAAANGIAVNDGLMYENTASDKFRIYSGSVWQDYDASAQQQQAAAALSASAAASSAAAAHADSLVTAEDRAAVHADRLAADADAAATAADRTAVHADRVAADADAAATAADRTTVHDDRLAADADAAATAADRTAVHADRVAADADAVATAADRVQTGLDRSAAAASASAAATSATQAATFTPSTYARLDGATFTGAVSGTSASFTTLSVGANAVWHAGNFNPASKQDALGFTPANSTITITAGTGLSGGGALTASRTLSFDQAWGDGRYVLASNVGTTANKIVALDSNSKLPAVDGSQLFGIATGGIVDVQTFTQSGTWTKPSSGTWLHVEIWSAGGGGARNTGLHVASGGNGGGYRDFWLPLSLFGATETVTVGAGGAGSTTNGTNGSPGGNSSFGNLVVYGASVIAVNGVTTIPGGSIRADGYDVCDSANIIIPTIPGLGGWSAFMDSFLGAGAGAMKPASSGSSVAGGISKTGMSGNGGASSAYNSGTGSNGAFPGGGGGGGFTAGGAGAKGQVRVTVFK